MVENYKKFCNFGQFYNDFTSFVKNKDYSQYGYFGCFS